MRPSRNDQVLREDGIRIQLYIIVSALSAIQPEAHLLCGFIIWTQEARPRLKRGRIYLRCGRDYALWIILHHYIKSTDIQLPYTGGLHGPEVR